MSFSTVSSLPDLSFSTAEITSLGMVSLSEIKQGVYMYLLGSFLFVVVFVQLDLFALM